MKKAVYFVVLLTLVLQTGFLSGLPVRAQGEVTPTPSESPTSTPESTATATETASPTATDTPLPTETSTATATATASATPSATETPTSAPTATAASSPSATPTEFVPPVVDELTLVLATHPTVIRRGKELALEWGIEGLKEVAKGMTLRIYLPTDVTPVDPTIGTYRAKAGTLEMELVALKGSVSFNVGEKAESPLVIKAELLQAEKALAQAEISLFEANETLIARTGGKAEGMRGRVTANFPADAVGENVRVSINRPSKLSLPVESLSGSPFEITAISEQSKAEVSRFSTPVEIQVIYDEGELSGSEEDIRLFWFDPTDQQWKLPLSQRVDTENNIIYAYTDHFTVFDTYNSGWQSANTPTMEFFQHAGYTGAASFSMPIKLPAGPGGFQPSLSLSYNSQTVDSATTDTQASWVGMGWSLDAAAYIERNGVGTKDESDDSYNLTLQGMGGALWKGADNRYHLENENFAKITFNATANTWTVLDKQGNQYYFEEIVGATKITNCPGQPEAMTNLTWRWMLKRAVNIYGKEITYTYAQEGQSHAWTDPESGCAIQVVHANAVYPNTIKYANGRYQVRFQRTPRYDYEPEWLTLYRTGVFKTFQKSLLANIYVEQDSNGDGAFETIIRKYHFGYCVDESDYPSCNIFPAYVWPSQQNYRTPTLTTVREYGLGGTSSLPAYSFEYGDGMHLTNATNGYGGSVDFTYNSWYQNIPVETWSNGWLESDLPRWGNPLKCTFQENAECGWDGVVQLQLGKQGYVSGGPSYIRVKGLAEKTIDSYQPGRWYRIVAGVKRSVLAPGGTHIKLGYSLKVNNVQQTPQYYDLTTATGLRTLESEPFFLPRDTTSFKVLIDSLTADDSDGYHDIYWYYLVPLPTYSRVATRTLKTASDSYVFRYEYEGEATNIPLNPDGGTGNSAAAATTHPYSSAYSEFRGHQYVIVTDPYGKEVRTEYGQTDCLSGKVLNMEARDGGGVLARSSSNSYYWGTSECKETTPPSASIPVDTEWPFGNVSFTGIMYRWSPLRDETNNTHDALGVNVAHTAAHYNYNQAYGNLIEKTISGTSIPTLVMNTEYYLNTSNGRWLVGLPSRIWGMEGGNTVFEAINLYEDSQYPGVVTATRTLIDQALNRYSQTSFTHDEWGNVTSQKVWTGYGTATDPPTTGLQTTTIVYDPDYDTYPISITNPLGQVTNINYSSVAVPNTAFTGYTLGVPVWEYGPNGVATKVEAEYDVFGRLVKLIRPGDSSASPTLAVSYINTPFTVTLTQKIDDTQSFEIERKYDGLGRPTLVTANNSILVNYTYGYENGIRVDKQSMPHTSAESTYWAKVKYDSMGRPSRLTAPDGTMTNYAYNGLETTVTDANENATSTFTNVLGQTLTVTPSTGPAIAFTYDALGNLKTAERGATVYINYDTAGRKKSMDDPDMGYWTYDYDALGNLKTQTDARGCVTTLQYDALNRLTNKAYSSCPSTVASTASVSYGYDAGTNGKGQRTSMDDGSGSTDWLYDTRGRMTKETKVITNTFATEWTYNSADLPVTMKYPGGEVVTNTYNNRMLLETVIGDDTYVSNINNDSAGRMTLRALGNGKSQIFTYYDWNEQVNGVGQGGRLEALFTSGLQNMAYQYDAVGNVKQIVDYRASETSTYQYDELNRLRFWTLNGVTEEYKYDGQGNLDDKNGLDLEYQDANHVHAATHIGLTRKYWYDDNGNQTTRIYGADTYTQIYDAENRMVEVKKGSNTVAQFVYNGDGQKVKSIVNGETIQFVNGYYEKKGSEITKYYLAGASRVAMRKYTVPQNMELEFMLGDHLGSTNITTDTTGARVSEMRYKPWGEVRFHWVNSNLTTTPAYKLSVYTFTGQRSYMDDPSTTGVEGFGLLDYNARFYDPMTGRFVSADSIVPGGVQGLDRYAYVNNSPVMRTDPSGHEAAPAEYSEPEECLLFSCVYNVTFVGLDSVHMAAAMMAVILVGQRLASTRGLEETNAEAFNAKFKDGVTIIWDPQCKECRDSNAKNKDTGKACGDDYNSPGCKPGGGHTNGNEITFASMAGDNSWDFSMDRMIKNVVHELGHVYYHAIGDPALENNFSRDALRPNVGDKLDWQMHPGADGNELFADTFIAWTYDAWNTDPSYEVGLAVDKAKTTMNGFAK